MRIHLGRASPRDAGKMLVMVCYLKAQWERICFHTHPGSCWQTSRSLLAHVQRYPFHVSCVSHNMANSQYGLWLLSEGVGESEREQAIGKLNLFVSSLRYDISYPFSILFVRRELLSPVHTWGKKNYCMRYEYEEQELLGTIWEAATQNSSSITSFPARFLYF